MFYLVLWSTKYSSQSFYMVCTVAGCVNCCWLFYRRTLFHRAPHIYVG